MSEFETEAVSTSVLHRRRLLTIGATSGVVGLALGVFLEEPARATTTLGSSKSVTTLTPNQSAVALPSDSYDQVNFSTDAAAGSQLTVTITASSPSDGQLLLFRITSQFAQDYSWPSNINWGTYGVAPSTSSGSNLTDYFLFGYRASASGWDALAYVPGFN
jgi:hypothetical protein